MGSADKKGAKQRRYRGTHRLFFEKNGALMLPLSDIMFPGLSFDNSNLSLSLSLLERKGEYSAAAMEEISNILNQRASGPKDQAKSIAI